ncbi:MAG: tRNA (adenosine(37)-N6)-threonylcarbamoyltransferase complex dimerization subunit type 1 TsaB [Bacteroidetes bacterium]|nr:tRNA (adenosine(37)-N6)-threonylcarbamoyltransferase complex dimerization subunit type 1 TsaB [Bacteroidota bacterium]
MGLILLIETATEVCSVGLALDGQIISMKETEKGNSHSANVAVFIDEVLKQANKSPGDLNAVAVSKGPGSYTGLRIGVSSAKGLCYGLNIPLISINTLKAMVYGVIHDKKVENTGALFCPMIDARRMEVYSGIYDMNLNQIREVQANIVDENTYTEYLLSHNVYFFGNGSDKCKDILNNNANAHFITDIKLSAANMAGLAEEKFRKEEFEDTAYFEPFYLKDFIAAKPVVKGLY